MAITQVGRTTYDATRAAKKRYYVLNIGVSGDTFKTGLKQILSVHTNNPGAVTLVAASGGTLTFTTTGAVNGVLVDVTGR